MNNPTRTSSNGVLTLPFPLIFGFSNEIETQRRRKGSGPTGRAKAPARRQQSGGTPGGGIPGGGGFQPSSGGRRSGGLRLPWWMVVIVIIIFICFGGSSLLGDLFGFGSNDGYIVDQQPVNDYNNSNVPAVGFTPPANSQPGSWTIMLYQDADDRILEKDIFMDFNEAERVGSTDMVNIVAQIDRYQGGFSAMATGPPPAVIT